MILSGVGGVRTDWDLLRLMVPPTGFEPVKADLEDRLPIHRTGAYSDGDMPDVTVIIPHSHRVRSVETSRLGEGTRLVPGPAPT